MIRALTVLLGGGAVANAAQDLSSCFVELPVYDARGERVPVTITAVTPEGVKSIDLLNAKQPELRVSVRGDTLYYSREWIGKRRLEVTLRSESGVKLVRRVPLMDCQQRASDEHGQLDQGFDVAFSTVTGRVVGCQLKGDWWIRAMAMFGSLETPMLHEGFIRPTDGVFRITSSMRGERHIIVVGKDKRPVKVFAFDVVRGAKNDVGDIDLSGSCPK